MYKELKKNGIINYENNLPFNLNNFFDIYLIINIIFTIVSIYVTYTFNLTINYLILIPLIFNAIIFG